MIKAIIFVVAVALVVIAIVVIVNDVNARTEEDERKSRLKFDPRTGVYYDPDVMERTETKTGVISYKSKKK